MYPPESNLHKGLRCPYDIGRAYFDRRLCVRDVCDTLCTYRYDVEGDRPREIVPANVPLVLEAVDACHVTSRWSDISLKVSFEDAAKTCMGRSTKPKQIGAKTASSPAIKFNDIIQGDALQVLKTLPDESVDCCVTSPPYFRLRSYLPEGHELKPLEMGLEESPEAYVKRLVKVFREVRRVLKKDGTCWIVIGDVFAKDGTPGSWDPTVGDRNLGGKSRPKKTIPKGYVRKELIPISWLLGIALHKAGWIVRDEIIWAKPNPMPESVQNRTTRAHERILMLTKSEFYNYDVNAIIEPAKSGWNGSSFTDERDILIHPSTSKKARSGNVERKYGSNRDRPDSHLGASIPWEGDTRHKRSVWTVATSQNSECHFAVYPEELIEPCIKAGCPQDGIVLDPFMGSGTTGAVALRLNRRYLGIELNPEYIKLANKRIYNNCRQLTDYAKEAMP